MKRQRHHPHVSCDQPAVDHDHDSEERHRPPHIAGMLFAAVAGNSLLTTPPACRACPYLQERPRPSRGPDMKLGQTCYIVRDHNGQTLIDV
jgi:hypothetical protein